MFPSPNFLHSDRRHGLRVAPTVFRPFSLEPLVYGTASCCRKSVPLNDGITATHPSPSCHLTSAKHKTRQSQRHSQCEKHQRPPVDAKTSRVKRHTAQRMATTVQCVEEHYELVDTSLWRDAVWFHHGKRQLRLVKQCYCLQDRFALLCVEG